MLIWKWLNPRRLRDYPRLIFIASWAVLILNIVFQHGWIGGLTGIMLGGDFISNYSGGVLYKTDINHLYDPYVQQENQAALIAPNQSPGFAPFISPPYVGLAMSLITHIPLAYAFALWEIINLLCVGASVLLISKFLLPNFISNEILPPYQILIIITSSFAFVDGFLAGQSHGIILLLCTVILVSMMKEKWFVAGLMGSILLYKPQFVVGYLLCWVIWRRMRSLLSFGIFTLIWQLPVFIEHGFAPYSAYLKFTSILMYLPYAKDSFPISIMATPYAFFSTLLPSTFSKVIQVLLLLVIAGMVALLSYMAYQSADLPVSKRYLTYSMAILLPLVIAPHTLIYDLLILVLVFALLSNYQELSQPLKLLCIIFYICLLFLPLLGYFSKLALPGLIPLALLAFILIYNYRPKIIAALSL